MEHKKEFISLPTILIDSREKQPYLFKSSENLAGTETATLSCGDYTLKEYSNLIIIERKNSIIELCGNIGKNRKRFVRELEKMQDFKFKFIIIEDYWSSIWKKTYTNLSPNSIFGSIIALELKYGIHFILAGTRVQAHQITRALLVKAYQYKLEGKI